jgi:ABC-type nitrate/sulfonate/bicarbonate transport system permease component
MLGTSAADTALSFAAISLLAVLGLVLYGAVSLLEWLVERRMGVSITTNEF